MTQPITHKDRSQYLKCVLYECNVLAHAVRKLRQSKDADSEVAKTAGVLKLRTVYDFMHRPQACDTIKRNMFNVYDPAIPPAMNTEWETWLTHQSINTYFAHLDRRRIEKTIPQPKFQRGARAIVNRAVMLLQQVRAFAESIINHKDFPGLDTYGKRYWNDFLATLDDLQK